MTDNQQVVFLSDGGENIRDLPRYLNPQAEHILDWFHSTMRLTVLRQMTRSLPPSPPGHHDADNPDDRERVFCAWLSEFRGYTRVLNGDLPGDFARWYPGTQPLGSSAGRARGLTALASSALAMGIQLTVNASSQGEGIRAMPHDQRRRSWATLAAIVGRMPSRERCRGGGGSRRRAPR
jgi:hypothetical protein